MQRISRISRLLLVVLADLRDAAEGSSGTTGMKCSPTNSRLGTTDVDLCPASPMIVLAGPQDPFGGRNSAVSDPIPVRVVGLVRRNEGTIGLKWPGEGAGEGQMGNVGLEISYPIFKKKNIAYR